MFMAKPKSLQENAKDICNVLLEFAVRKDDSLLQTGEGDQIDDKTVFIIKKN